MVWRPKDSIIAFKFTACSHQDLAVAVLPPVPLIYTGVFSFQWRKKYVNGAFSRGNSKFTREVGLSLLRKFPFFHYEITTICLRFWFPIRKLIKRILFVHWPHWFGGISYPLGNWRKVQKGSSIIQAPWALSLQPHCGVMASTTTSCRAFHPLSQDPVFGIINAVT